MSLPATDTNTHHTAHEHTCKQILTQVIHVSGVMHTDTDRPTRPPLVSHLRVHGRPCGHAHS